jgi:hypothetical protein
MKTGLMRQCDHIFFEESSPLSVSEKARAAKALALQRKPRRAAACVLTTKLTRNAGDFTDKNWWLSGFVISYLRKGWDAEVFPEAVPLSSTLYRATRGGCVIETEHNTVVYEPLEGVSPQAIADALNWYHVLGINADWRLVEQRLVEQGVLSECRA